MSVNLPWDLSRKITASTSSANATYWDSVGSVSDDGTVELPTITANYSMHGIIQVSSAGAITTSAEFEADSAGNVILIRGGASVVANADTDGKLCIGVAVANPVVVRNRLGGVKNIMIEVRYK